MLLRCYRLKESLALTDHAALLDAEFYDSNARADLSLSCYQVANAEALKAFLEHRAGNGLDVARWARGVDLSGDAIRHKPENAESAFHLVRTSHHVVLLDDEAALAALVQRLVESGQQSRLDASKQEICEWLQQQIDEKNPEWAKFFAEEACAASWIRKLRLTIQPPPTGAPP